MADVADPAVPDGVEDGFQVGDFLADRAVLKAAPGTAVSGKRKAQRRNAGRGQAFGEGGHEGAVLVSGNPVSQQGKAVAAAIVTGIVDLFSVPVGDSSEHAVIPF